MPLSQQQRAALEAEAKKQGVDPAELITEAEALVDGEQADRSERGAVAKKAERSGEPPKLFMYHLPFVRVREVRKIWLGLDEPFLGDESIASEWAAKFTGGATPPDDEPA